MNTAQRAPRTRFAVVAGLVSFLLAGSGGAAWAYWTAQATATGTVTTSTVAVAQTNFATPATTTYLPSSLTSTRNFSLVNNSGIAGVATATISAPEAYAANLSVSVWPVANAAACTDASTVPTTGVVSGTWASLSLTTPSLAAGASQFYCARTTIADWKTITTSTGGAVVNPQLAVSIDADGWAATGTGASHVQQTQGMYPLVTAPFFDSSLSSTWHTVRSVSNSGYCLDVSGSGGNGANIVTWGCHNDANQRWQFLPVSGNDQSLVTLRPRHAPTTRLTTATTTAGTVTVATASGSTAQQWYVQRVSATLYQLVSAATGRCLPLDSVNSVSTATVDCNSVTARLSFAREGLTFSTSGTSATVTFGGASFGFNAGQTGTLQRQTGATTWTNVSTIAATDTSETFTPPNNATTTYRIVFGTGTDVAYFPFTITRNGSAITSTGLG